MLVCMLVLYAIIALFVPPVCSGSSLQGFYHREIFGSDLQGNEECQEETIDLDHFNVFLQLCQLIPCSLYL
jgi:hypothetical protein